ncbi:hypothetical protein [Sphingomonas swuensis]|uniref:hypothetical protein n=1 Tax=Sphingomonas swuensis TaxID=977800 RepID=UPI0031D91D8F
MTAPREQIADSLSSYGLDRPRAECIGGNLQADLSVGQLLQLSRAAQAYRQNDSDPSRLGLDDLLRVSSQLKDPAIPIAIAKASGRCGIVPTGFTALLGVVRG